MTIKLETIFEKPIDRRIEGVIKADDDEGLLHELEEYVITDEVNKHLGTFLDAYGHGRNDNGVWISGFFGSGKSHLLKMLALLLENREVHGRTALEIFQEKTKDDALLRASMERAAKTPSQSILFNIDQKADVIDKTQQVDALLAVFQKVFDDACGYFGKQAYVAQFERHLDENGQYAAFKDAYEDIADKPWKRGREQHLLESGSIAKAYARVSGGSEEEAAGILKRYRDTFKVSIEDFAEQINRYVDRQEKDFRLNFFVDEVGQYIADNVKLMTNLQTVAESLATKCRGKAWLIVTAQQEMKDIVGDMSKQKGLDFSKIQARFDTRMPLTSANVSEVIQKRLLKKTAEAEAPVGELFDQHHTDMRTLFTFSDNSIQLKGFRDRDHFIASYPFLPYQYDLFQLAIKELSDHNAFEGRHASVGERSMLGVFQQVAKNIKDLELGTLAPFDLMYEGIRSALKASVQTSVQMADRNLSNDLAKRVLKALFLVKYVKQFKPTLENICVLVRTRFDGDAAQLSRDVEAALSELERQTYIQRNGTLYEFLTDEEKDVEDEIKNTEIDRSEMMEALQGLLFGTGLRLAKVRHEATGADYPFARKIDDQLAGRAYELEINIVTPFHPESSSIERFRMQTLTSNELCVVLPEDPRFIQDLGLMKKTEKYVRQAASQSHQPILQRIIGDKREQISQREHDLERYAKRLLGQARLFVRGQELEIGGEDAQARVFKAFNALVDKVYTNLGQLRGVSYSEAHISEYLAKKDDGLFGAAGTGMEEAEQSVLNHIRRQKDNALRSSVKSVIEEFEKAPYGWPRPAIQAQLAALFARGRVDARKDSQSLNASEFGKALRNTHEFGNIVLEPQIEFTQGQIAALKSFYKEFFNDVPKASEPKALAEETLADLKKAADELRVLERDNARYPFIEKLAPAASKIAELAQLGVAGLYGDLSAHSDAVLDLKDDVIDPVRTFLNGDQRRIFDDGWKLLENQQTNLGYLDEGAADALRAILADPDCHRGDRMRQLRGEVEQLQSAIDTRIATARKDAAAALTGLKAYLEGVTGYERVRSQAETAFSAAQRRIDDTPSIPLIDRAVEDFKQKEYLRLFEDAERVENALTPAPAGATAAAGGQAVQEPPAASIAPAPLVPVNSLRLAGVKPVLTTEQDVDTYLETLRDRLLAEVRSGKRISL
jgi:hypothetical protein